MITEIVTFEMPNGMGRNRVIELFEESTKIWRAHQPFDISKHL